MAGNSANDPLRLLQRSLIGLFVVAAVSGAAAAGYAVGRSRAETPAASTTVYLDAEYTYLGAVRSWPERPQAKTKNPFRGFGDARLIGLGRAVCIHATDPGLDFNGVLELLKLNPHQTYVVITEAIDKLCPSQREQLRKLRS